MPNDFNQQVIDEFRANKGRVGGYFEGARLILLTTTGARTGRPHTTPVGYLPDGADRVLVIASAGGAPSHPAWFHNLLAHPQVTIESGAFTYEAQAVVLDGEERERAFARAVEADPGWAEYQEKTRRVIPVVALHEIAQALTEIVTRECEAARLQTPRISVEPGRAIVGPTAFTLYEVGTIKPLDGLRTYVSVDGGMSDNIRTALYDAEYSVALVSRTSDAEPMLARVVGKHCESGDIVVKDAFLPADLAPGDLIAVPATGAYCRSMASNYNHVLRPPVVAVNDGESRVIVRRETEEDLLRLDVG